MLSFAISCIKVKHELLKPARGCLTSKYMLCFLPCKQDYSNYYSVEKVSGDLAAQRDCTHCGVYSLQAYAAEFIFTGGDEYSHTIREIYKGFTAIELL